MRRPRPSRQHIPLDNGSPDDPRIGPQQGLWDVPAYYLPAPPRLRAGVKPRWKAFDVSGGKVTGLDWNMMIGVAGGGAGFNKDEYLETLKYSLDQRRRGNRAPLLIGDHSQFYAAQPLGRDFNPPNISVTLTNHYGSEKHRSREKRSCSIMPRAWETPSIFAGTPAMLPRSGPLWF